MKTQALDFIGDIHGQHGKLVSLLRHLGYRRHDSTFRHPAGRRVVFLGDCIDRGPAVRETLHTVRGMMEAGDAFAIMGNHEFNMVLIHTPDGRGGFLRPRTKLRGGENETLRQFEGRDAEWTEWVAWMKRLPMFLDLDGVRAVHACWDSAAIARLHDASLEDPQFLTRAATPATQEHLAVENLLKGPELAMPPGHVFHDKEGIPRSNVRVRWWDLPGGPAQITRLAMPEPFDVAGDASADALRGIPNYPPDAPPVFFGHYWLPPRRKREPLAPNLACLDFSAAFGENPLVAYRWDGEPVLAADKFTAVCVAAGSTPVPTLPS